MNVSRHARLLNAAVRRGIQRRLSMTMQSSGKGSEITNNVWVQLGILAAVAAIVIVIASRYVW
jgi:hypothetical protein